MATYTAKTLTITKFNDTTQEVDQYVISPDAYGILYGVCSSAANAQTKTVTIPGISALGSGQCVRIKFEHSQAYNGQPKLQINSLTAVNIVRYGSVATEKKEWLAGEVLDFIYDGTNFIIVDGAKNNDATANSHGLMSADDKGFIDNFSIVDGKVNITYQKEIEE